MCTPTGIMELYLGKVSGTRLEMEADAIAVPPHDQERRVDGGGALNVRLWANSGHSSVGRLSAALGAGAALHSPQETTPIC